MLKHVFEADPRVFAFGEFSELSSADTDERLRLNPLDAVERQFASRPFPVAVAKPLVESQRCAELLEYFPDARAPLALSQLSRRGGLLSRRLRRFVRHPGRACDRRRRARRLAPMRT